MSAYDNDARVEIGAYEAWVASPDGPKYVWAVGGPDDWEAGPASLQGILIYATRRGDAAEILRVRGQYPHYPTLDDAIRSLIGDPQ
jgi:hypothetical protein